jgi:transcriptional regulator with XRE-family HTH domain
MPFHVGPEVTPLVVRSRIALGLTQKQLGAMFRASVRTAHRWEGGKAYPSVEQLLHLARTVLPVDAQLAGQLAVQAGTTLQAMGLVEAPSPPVVVAPPPLAPQPPPRPFPPIGLMIDSILVAAGDAIEDSAAPPIARPVLRGVLRAAFSRARALGVTIDEVDDALALPTPPKARSGKT